MSGSDKRTEIEERLAIARHLPSLGFLSLLAVAFTVAGAVVWPISKSTRRGALAAQPVSNHHRLIAAACERCHAAPFTGASDDRCLSCHQVGEHADAIASKKVSHVDRCASCHKEHHGQRSLVPADSPLCTGCHADLLKVFPETVEPAVRDFAHHPEFAVRLASGEVVRLDSERASDPSVLKFSHVEHLGSVRGKGAEPETLSCESCHARASGSALFAPIEFERHCRRCHSLEADRRLPGTRVPHGDVEAAVSAVRAALAEYNLNANQGSSEKPDALRRRTEAETREGIDALLTEQDGCSRCHEVTAGGPPERRLYQVIPPRVRARWLASARFDHGVHRQTACVECHTRARSSTTATEILIPGITVCRSCHADPGTPDKVESPCVECHVYHPKR